MTSAGSSCEGNTPLRGGDRDRARRSPLAAHGELPIHGLLGQEREHGHAPTTVLALQNVHLEHARQQLGPRNT